MTSPSALSLAEIPPGAEAVVSGIGGGRELAARLAGLGLIVGSQLKVLQNAGRGPMLVLVRDTRVALGRGEATRIAVTRVGG